jgi:hypothetical protein
MAMSDSGRKTITPAEWEMIVDRRIQAMYGEWDRLSVDDRFWLVFNWTKEFNILNSSTAKRQLFICKPYWQKP